MSYREDPRWLAAAERYLDESGTPDDNLVNSIFAAIEMREIECEYEYGDRSALWSLLRPTAVAS